MATVPPEPLLAQAQSRVPDEPPDQAPKPKDGAAAALAMKRAASLTPEERSKIAKKAAKARWGKNKRKRKS